MDGHGQHARSGPAAVLGLELGTGGVKALVTDPDGGPLGRGAAGYRVAVPGSGCAEIAPEEWWLATRSAVRDALAEAGRVHVTALAVAGPMHGVVLADERGAPLRPAILGADQRATAEAAMYAELPGEYTAGLGNRPAPGLPGPLLCWLATHEPRTLRAAWWVLQPKDWLRLRLTGQAATDPTDASGTLLFDLVRGQWAVPLLEKLGLPLDKLPPLTPPAGIAGRLRPNPAAELGLPPGIPVATGAADTAAALFAAGPGPHDALLNLGGGGQWTVPVPPPASALAPDTAAPSLNPPLNPALTPAPGANLYRAVGDGFYRLAPVPDAGLMLDWVRHLLGATWDELYAGAARPRRPDAPRFAPRRSPETGMPGAAAWAGLTPAHDRGDLMRSALDGVAGLLRERLDDLRAAGPAPRRVILAGGGTEHPAWRALLEETLELPLTQAATSWLAPAGAARLAAAAAR